MCNKQDFFEWIKVTETHPNKYYFERIDAFDNALVRSFLPPPGPGSLHCGEVTRRPGAPLLRKTAKFEARGS